MPLGLLALWLGLVVLFFFYQTDRELREAMAAAERDSPGGWQLEELEAAREPVPENDNAALVALKVKELLPPGWPLPDGSVSPSGLDQSQYDRLLDLAPEVQLDGPLAGALRASLGRVETARAEAHKLIGMSRGRFPINWADNVFATSLQSQDVRPAARLLRLEAALASQDADADRALACVRGLAATARAIGDEPFLISVLCRVACDAQTVAALERALAQGEPSTAELVKVQALLEQEAAEPLLTRALRGERAGLDRTLLALRDRRLTLAQLLDQGTVKSSAGIQRKLLDASGPTLARRAHPRMLRLLNEFVEASKLPLEEQPRVMDEVARKVIQAKVNYDVITALLMPAFQKAATAYRRGVGNLRCAFVAVALERYRRDHGCWPPTLDALVPTYLPAVPADPQDGSPLRFQRRPDGVVVYWIGQDGTDDGGKLNRRDPLARGFDQGVQLWDPKERRQPPAELLPRPREAAPSRAP
jgi:hypothetical protein